MYSFRRTEGWYDGRPVAAGSTPSKLIAAKSSASTNTSITRTGLLSSMKSSRHSGNSVHCPRSASSTKRLIISPTESRGRIITAARRFHTARVKFGSPGAQLGSLPYPQEQTSLAGPVRSEERQYRTWPQRPHDRFRLTAGPHIESALTEQNEINEAPAKS